jgi:hypothetical protein
MFMLLLCLFCSFTALRCICWLAAPATVTYNTVFEPGRWKLQNVAKAHDKMVALVASVKAIIYSGCINVLHLLPGWGMQCGRCETVSSGGGGVAHISNQLRFTLVVCCQVIVLATNDVHKQAAFV